MKTSSPTDLSTPWRVAFYGRNSSSINGPGSEERQFEAIRNRLRMQQRRWQEVATYFDEGVCGRRTDRPSLNRLFADLRQGRIQVDAIVVESMDRLHRSSGNSLGEWLQREFKIAVFAVD